MYAEARTQASMNSGASTHCGRPRAVNDRTCGFRGLAPLPPCSGSAAVPDFDAADAFDSNSGSARSFVPVPFSISPRFSISRTRRDQKPHIVKLWNDVLSAVFPIDYDKGVFKKRVYSFLRSRQRTGESSEVVGLHRQQ
ncbi:hypothetical protein EVAR_56003_1 [Eumeta japonica]|uniref:Uncharacterized protein n=1 Tax=Eumeta variegata TaxID=151549 RepID=A0A4C1YZ97_EUMVA|nr:hypothetical protein EVAR_56003_1 [Eumeta japonica]